MNSYFDRLSHTIVASATAPGSSIGIIRLSGSISVEIALSISDKKLLKPRSAEVCRISSEDVFIEQALVLYFKEPASYTGEDVVELQIHGAAGQAETIMKLALSKGAIPALNGEFTFRAVIHGKMTLQKAAAIPHLAMEHNELALSIIRKEYFNDKFTAFLSEFLKKWSRYHALATSITDFPDYVEEYLPHEEIIEAVNSLEKNLRLIKKNSSRFLRSQKLKIVMAGKTNSGKSTLFNALLEQDRAIVSKEEGTTRDFITHSFDIENISVNLVDTAGLRDTDSDIENEGIKRSCSQVESASLILLIIDPTNSEAASVVDFYNRHRKNKKIIAVTTKRDISKAKLCLPFSVISVSAHSGYGIEKLRNRLREIIKEDAPDPSEPVVFNSVMLSLVEKSLLNCEELRKYITSDFIEISAQLIHEINKNLLILSGNSPDVDIYEKIFSDFCIGK